NQNPNNRPPPPLFPSYIATTIPTPTPPNPPSPAAANHVGEERGEREPIRRAALTRGVDWSQGPWRAIRVGVGIATVTETAIPASPSPVPLLGEMPRYEGKGAVQPCPQHGGICFGVGARCYLERKSIRTEQLVVLPLMQAGGGVAEDQAQAFPSIPSFFRPPAWGFRSNSSNSSSWKDKTLNQWLQLYHPGNYPQGRWLLWPVRPTRRPWTSYHCGFGTQSAEGEELAGYIRLSGGLDTILLIVLLSSTYLQSSKFTSSDMSLLRLTTIAVVL
ncbi:hypothetical protein Taro_002834, partial [Colocasia esculenta]|nr:hypothetical protein [Colocasia esculenta]